MVWLPPLSFLACCFVYRCYWQQTLTCINFILGVFNDQSYNSKGRQGWDQHAWSSQSDRRWAQLTVTSNLAKQKQRDHWIIGQRKMASSRTLMNINEPGLICIRTIRPITICMHINALFKFSRSSCMILPN